jgi:cytochrome c oxidase subunit 1
MSAHGATTEGEEPLNYLNSEKGFWSWIMTIDHKRLGLLYLFSIITFFVLGGIMALLVRLELWSPEPGFLTDTQYNRAFTSHGVMMIFLFIVPGVPATLGNFLLPLMIGAKDVAFPKLNRFSYWIYLIGAGIGAAALLGGIDTGWTFYSPYSIQNRWEVVTIAFAAFVLGFSSILTGLNFLVTIHKMRAPGMIWNRVPLFVWTLYATSILQVVATPVIGITLLLLIVENTFKVGIFNPDFAGDPVLFQHFFWFYSHPVVYIMILPAFGIISEIIPVFCRKPIFGYRAMVIASVGIALISFIVWAHHMFVAGMSNFARYVFSALTFLVAIPTAVKVFNWVGTMYKGSIIFATPMLYAISFNFLFLIAGCTGIHLATLAVNAHYHDTYFVVAHFHYTIQGGAVIGLYAGLHFWFPKMFGRMYNETMAKIAWLLLFIGFNGTFLPQFVLGMMGMPRRYYTYPPEFQTLHQVSTVFAFMNGLGYSLVLINFFYSAKWGKKAPANPWNSLSLEWQTPSPPPHDNFEKIPVVTDWSYGYGMIQSMTDPNNPGLGPDAHAQSPLGDSHGSKQEHHVPH